LLTDFAGQPLGFNRPETVHGALIAAGPARHATLVELLQGRLPELA
jgi:myo-inositol-1(or 4)-monophosphatase